MKVSILQVNVTKQGEDRYIISLKIGCRNISHYNSIVSRLRSLQGVLDIARGFM
jgi:(p)ppGpp synthase/HD superfamily hydrolase